MQSTCDQHDPKGSSNYKKNILRHTSLTYCAGVSSVMLGRDYRLVFWDILKVVD